MNKARLSTMLEELCGINGVSGDEQRVRDYIIEKIGDAYQYSVSPLGNLIVYYKGAKASKNKLMISAHMDEVGMIVTSINSDGTLGFNCVGGVDASVCAGRQVKVGEYIGTVGSTAIHNLSSEQREKLPKFDSLYIDIGAEDKEDAEKHITLGDNAYFIADYVKLGDEYIRSKAIDDRAGCAIMLEMILSQALDYDCVFTFVVQEEIGLRGGKTAAYEVDAEFALVLETTTAADIPLASGAKKCCELGKGAVVSYMDRSTSYDKELYKLAMSIAKENNIKAQTKTMVAGGNDSGAIHISKAGIRTTAISLPCRYLHSPSCVIKEEDFFSSYDLAVLYANRVLSGEI